MMMLLEFTELFIVEMESKKLWLVSMLEWSIIFKLKPINFAFCGTDNW